MKNSQRRSISSGFTLIELLVVIVIIGLLAAILLPNMLGMRARARDARLKSELSELKTALQIYYSDNQKFPDAAVGGQMVACGATGTTNCVWGESFATGTKTYMEHLPMAESGDIIYSQPSGDQGYLLKAPIESASDEEAARTAARCNVGPSFSDTTTYYYACP